MVASVASSRAEFSPDATSKRMDRARNGCALWICSNYFPRPHTSRARLVWHTERTRDTRPYAVHTLHTMHMRVYFTLRARRKDESLAAGNAKQGVIRTHKSHLNIPSTLLVKKRTGRSEILNFTKKCVPSIFRHASGEGVIPDGIPGRRH